MLPNQSGHVQSTQLAVDDDVLPDAEPKIKGDVGSLSGGERSFSTLVRPSPVSFVLSVTATAVPAPAPALSSGSGVYVCGCLVPLQSLLCAINRVMDAPFRMYDEFDVYMDESVRSLFFDSDVCVLYASVSASEALPVARVVPWCAQGCVG